MARDDTPTLSRRDWLTMTSLAVPAMQLGGCAGVDWEPEGIPESTDLFPRTVIAGDMGPEHIVLAVYVADKAPKTLRIWKDGKPRQVLDERTVEPDADGFVKVKVDGLLPGQVHQYAFFDGPTDGFTARSLIGRFQTLPREGRTPPMTLALGSCTGLGSVLPDYIRPDQTEPTAYPLYEMAAALDWDLFVHVGDQGYMDRIYEAGGTYEQYLAAWGMLHGGSYRNVYPKAAMVATWDDHEVTDNGTVDPWTTDPEEIARIEAGQRAWYRCMPIDGDDPATTPIWRSFRWGHTVEIVLLDCRYELEPDPDRHQMSEAQLQWFLDTLRDSPCRFVCVCTDKPFANIMLEGIAYPGRDERWQGHEADRKRVTDLIDAEGLDHVLFLTGDIHMNYLGRLSETGGAISDTLWEICTTSGNVNPAVNGLSEQQFDFKALEPHLPLVTFDATAGTVTVRFVAIDGTTTYERTLEIG